MVSKVNRFKGPWPIIISRCRIKKSCNQKPLPCLMVLTSSKTSLSGHPVAMLAAYVQTWKVATKVPLIKSVSWRRLLEKRNSLLEAHCIISIAISNCNSWVIARNSIRPCKATSRYPSQRWMLLLQANVDRLARRWRTSSRLPHSQFRLQMLWTKETRASRRPMQ